MLNKQELIQNMSITLVYILLTMIAITPLALARTYESDVYDLWNSIEEFEEVSSLRNFLLEKDWINEQVTIDQLDYILVLTRQCSAEFFPNVPTSLVLAVISVESGFNQELTGLSDDTGLMQIIPRFHHDRINGYLYDENVNLYDPRLNIMVGMDYLDELLTWSKGNLNLAVMAYNMGQLRAGRYFDAGKITSYTRTVIYRMDAIQDFLERRE